MLNTKSELSQIELATSVCQEIFASSIHYGTVLTMNSQRYSVDYLINFGKLKFCLGNSAQRLRHFFFFH